MRSCRPRFVAGLRGASAGEIRPGEIRAGDFSSAAAEEVPGGVRGGIPDGRRIANLPGVKATAFAIVTLEGETLLQMDAADAGASLYRPVRLDPAETPLLRWRWREPRAGSGHTCNMGRVQCEPPCGQSGGRIGPRSKHFMVDRGFLCPATVTVSAVPVTAAVPDFSA